MKISNWYMAEVTSCSPVSTLPFFYSRDNFISKGTLDKVWRYVKWVSQLGEGYYRHLVGKGQGHC